MSRIEDWCECAESMVRCLTAVTPDAGDQAFGWVQDIAGGGSSNPGQISAAGDWFRTVDGKRQGYIFIGPEGRDHHFQEHPPDGVDPASMKRMPPTPIGRLWREIEAALGQARALVAGESSTVGAAGPLVLRCEEADLPRVRAVAAVLEAACLLRQPGTSALLLRQSAQAFRDAAASGMPARLEAASAEITALRARCLADAPLWTVAMLRREALTRVIGEGPMPPLAFKLFDVSGVLGDPEEALRQTVSDLAYARHGDVVMMVCDAALERAETAVQSALDAQTVQVHQGWLYEAAGQAHAAMRIAELMRDKVAPKLWPQHVTDALLGGYVAQTEEIVIRAEQALAVGCINAGNRAAFHRHRTAIAAAGPAKADELIEEYWFYPRAARALLLRPAAPPAPTPAP
jgi:hypothetical protein